jgi:hypothetical protein
VGSCSAVGVVTARFNPIPGFLGPYIVTLGSREKSVDVSQAIFDFSGEDLSGATLSLRTTVDGIALGPFSATNVIIDHYVVISNVNVVQSTSQAKQGKATVTYQTQHGAAGTVYDLYRKLASAPDTSYNLDMSGISNNAVINTPLGVASRIYRFKIVA